MRSCGISMRPRNRAGIVRPARGDPGRQAGSSPGEFGKLRGIKDRVLDLATRHPRTNAAEQALVWLATDVSFDPEGAEGLGIFGPGLRAK